MSFIVYKQLEEAVGGWFKPAWLRNFYRRGDWLAVRIQIPKGELESNNKMLDTGGEYHIYRVDSFGELYGKARTKRDAQHMITRLRQMDVKPGRQL